MFNRLLIIVFCIFTFSCSNSKNTFTPLSEKSLAQIIEVENPIFLTIMINKYILYSNKLNPESIKKHNATIHTALMNPNNGVTHYWEHKYDRLDKKVFFGKVKIVNSTQDKRGVCRTWIEQIGRDNIYLLSASTTACMNKNQTKYVLANEFFYDQM